jgi:hypothetical protein
MRRAATMLARKAAGVGAAIALFYLVISPADACSGCGCRGGPGYRGPSGRCVGWADIGRTCGSPPTSRCTPEGPNVEAAQAAEFGLKAIDSRKPKSGGLR